jgi:WD40 repeat protein
MPAENDPSVSGSPAATLLADGGPPTEPARLDAFISYRRRPDDIAFVDWLQEALTGRGKQAWVDRRNIEPAADWSARIARGIESAKAFIFVITPESVVSGECLAELEKAAEHHKLIIPVVLHDVDRQNLPESLSRPNWIFFGPGRSAEHGLDELILALETDLGWRDAHTRLTVRASEWADSRRDRSFLLRGSDLRSAEEWLGQAGSHPKTPPTALQGEYVLASRKATVRTQRTWRAALSAGLVISLALAGLAFVQRNAARQEARIAQSHALAAEATADLSGHPDRSLSLALNATRIDPSESAQQALRLALAQDRLRMIIRSGTVSATVAAWNPDRAQIAVTAPHNSVALWNVATGHLSQTLRIAHSSPVTQLLYDPAGSRLAAVSAAGYVSMWNISANGTASVISTGNLNEDVQAAILNQYQSILGIQGVWNGQGGSEFYAFGQGLSNVLIFDPDTGTTFALFSQPFRNGGPGVLVPSPDTSKLLLGSTGVETGAEIIDLRAGHQIPLPSGSSGYTGHACWLPDGSAVGLWPSTETDAFGHLFRATDGSLLARLHNPVGPTTAVGCSTNPNDDWVAAGDVSGDVVLRLAGGTPLPLYGHNDLISAIASSPDGQYLATASADGTARLWDARTGRLFTVLASGSAPLTDVQFGPGGALAMTVDSLGLVRIWDTGVGKPVTELSQPAGGQTIAIGFTSTGRRVFGARVGLSSGAAAKITSVTALYWNARDGRMVRTVPLPGIVPSSVPCSAHFSDGDAFLTDMPVMSGNSCLVPPPSNLVVAVPVPRPDIADSHAILELIAVAASSDGKYVAYARSRSVALVGPDGKQAAQLSLASTPTGLSFGPSDELVVMTDAAIYLWRPLSGRPAEVFRQFGAPIDAALSQSGQQLAVADTTGAIRVWATRDGEQIRTFRPARGHASSPIPLRVALTDNGVVASGDDDGTVAMWNVATGKKIVTVLPSRSPIIELNAATDGSRLLAVDWPVTVTQPNPPADGEVINPATGQVVATYRSPAPLLSPIDPGAALSPDGSFMFAGSLGLAPAPPGGVEAVYQNSSGQNMVNLLAADQSAVNSYSLFPAQPWSPDGTELLAGNAIYTCDACGSLNEIQAAAASRIAWSQPLSASSDHPPRTNPYH